MRGEYAGYGQTACYAEGKHLRRESGRRHYRFRVPDSHPPRCGQHDPDSCRACDRWIEFDSGLLADDCWQVLSLAEWKSVDPIERILGFDIVIQAKKVERDGCEETHLA